MAHVGLWAWETALVGHRGAPGGERGWARCSSLRPPRVTMTLSGLVCYGKGVSCFPRSMVRTSLCDIEGWGFIIYSKEGLMGEGGGETPLQPRSRGCSRRT